MSKMWEIKMSKIPKTVDINIYSEIESDSWYKESDTSAKAFCDKLSEIDDIDNINIFINSVGGSVTEGIAIYNQLVRHKAYKTVYIDGCACSIASVIAMAGDKIIMPTNSVMMIHNAWTYAAGNASEFRKIADDLDKINSAIKNTYIERSGGKISNEKLSELMDAETYLNAEECISYGFADEYADYNVNLEKAKEIIESEKDNQINQYCQRLQKVCALADLGKIKTDMPKSFEDKAKDIIKGFFNSEK